MAVVDAQGIQVVVDVTVTVVKSRSMTASTSEQHIGTGIEVVSTTLPVYSLVGPSAGPVVMGETSDVGSEVTCVTELANVCICVSRIEVIGRRDAVVVVSPMIVVIEAAGSVVASVVAIKETSVLDESLILDEVVSDGWLVVIEAMDLLWEIDPVS